MDLRRLDGKDKVVLNERKSECSRRDDGLGWFKPIRMINKVTW